MAAGMKTPRPRLSFAALFLTATSACETGGGGPTGAVNARDLSVTDAALPNDAAAPLPDAAPPPDAALPDAAPPGG
jgi:hypothetical protein